MLEMLKLIKIPIRDWNAADLAEEGNEESWNLSKSLLGIETNQETESVEYSTRWNLSKSLLGIETDGAKV